jgi:hypothetical protein
MEKKGTFWPQVAPMQGYLPLEFAQDVKSTASCEHKIGSYVSQVAEKVI